MHAYKYYYLVINETIRNYTKPQDNIPLFLNLCHYSFALEKLPHISSKKIAQVFLQLFFIAGAKSENKH